MHFLLKTGSKGTNIILFGLVILLACFNINAYERNEIAFRHTNCKTLVQKSLRVPWYTPTTCPVNYFITGFVVQKDRGPSSDYTNIVKGTVCCQMVDYRGNILETSTTSRLLNTDIGRGGFSHAKGLGNGFDDFWPRHIAPPAVDGEFYSALMEYHPANTAFYGWTRRAYWNNELVFFGIYRGKCGAYVFTPQRPRPQTCPSGTVIGHVQTDQRSSARYGNKLYYFSCYEIKVQSASIPRSYVAHNRLYCDSTADGQQVIVKSNVPGHQTSIVTECRKCPSGHYCNGWGSTKCEAGFKCLRGVKTKCPPSTNSVAGSTFCFDLPLGCAIALTEGVCSVCLEGSGTLVQGQCVCRGYEFRKKNEVKCQSCKQNEWLVKPRNGDFQCMPIDAQVSDIDENGDTTLTLSIPKDIQFMRDIRVAAYLSESSTNHLPSIQTRNVVGNEVDGEDMILLTAENAKGRGIAVKWGNLAFGNTYSFWLRLVYKETKETAIEWWKTRRGVACGCDGTTDDNPGTLKYDLSVNFDRSTYDICPNWKDRSYCDEQYNIFVNTDLVGGSDSKGREMIGSFTASSDRCNVDVDNNHICYNMVANNLEVGQTIEFLTEIQRLNEITSDLFEAMVPVISSFTVPWIATIIVQAKVGGMTGIPYPVTHFSVEVYIDEIRFGVFTSQLDKIEIPLLDDNTISVNKRVRIVPSKMVNDNPHVFKCESPQGLIACEGHSVKIDHLNRAQFVIHDVSFAKLKGKVGHQGLDIVTDLACPTPGVNVCVETEGVAENQCRKTDANGEFIFVVPKNIPSKIFIDMGQTTLYYRTVEFNYDTVEEDDIVQFDRSSYSIQTEDEVEGLNFLYTKVNQLHVSFYGGECHLPLVDLILKVSSPTCPGFTYETLMSKGRSTHSIVLPAMLYNVTGSLPREFFLADPAFRYDLIEYLAENANMPASLLDSERHLTLKYPGKVSTTIKIKDSQRLCDGGFPLIETGDSVTFIFESKLHFPGGQTCAKFSNETEIRIHDNIGENGGFCMEKLHLEDESVPLNEGCPPDLFLPTSGVSILQVIAGKPHFFANYTKRISFNMKLPMRSLQTTTFDVIVYGEWTETNEIQSFGIPQSNPLTVLRNPPGDASFLVLEAGNSFEMNVDYINNYEVTYKQNAAPRSTRGIAYSDHMKDGNGKRSRSKSDRGSKWKGMKKKKVYKKAIKKTEPKMVYEARAPSPNKAPKRKLASAAKSTKGKSSKWKGNKDYSFSQDQVYMTQDIDESITNLQEKSRQQMESMKETTQQYSKSVGTTSKKITLTKSYSTASYAGLAGSSGDLYVVPNIRVLVYEKLSLVVDAHLENDVDMRCDISVLRSFDFGAEPVSDSVDAISIITEYDIQSVFIPQLQAILDSDLPPESYDQAKTALEGWKLLSSKSQSIKKLAIKNAMPLRMGYNNDNGGNINRIEFTGGGHTFTYGVSSSHSFSTTLGQKKAYRQMYDDDISSEFEYRKFSKSDSVNMKEKPQWHSKQRDYDCQCYIDRYTDLQKAFGQDCSDKNVAQQAKRHWITHGIKEKRLSLCSRDVFESVEQCQCYLDKYEDVAKSVGSSCADQAVYEGAATHYAVSGKKEKRTPYCPERKVKDMTNPMTNGSPMTDYTHLALSFNYVTSVKTSFTLADKDLGDKFDVEIYEDPIYGTPVFELKAGISKCPHEAGTVSREKVFLRAGPNFHRQYRNMMDDQTFTIPLEITNENPNEHVNVLLSVNVTSNSRNLKLTVNDVPLAQGIEISVPPFQKANVHVVVERGEGFYSFEDIQFMVGSICEMKMAQEDGLFRDPLTSSIYTSVNYIEPCTQVFVVEDLGLYDGYRVLDSSPSLVPVVIKSKENKMFANEKHLAYISLEYRQRGDLKWKEAVNGLNTNSSFSSFFYNKDLRINSQVDGTYSDFFWNVDELVYDGFYEVRVRSSCEVASHYYGADNFFTKTYNVIVDRQVPFVTETVPSDGMYTLGYEIGFKFNEMINCDEPHSYHAHLFINNEESMTNYTFYYREPHADPENKNMQDELVSFCNQNNVLFQLNANVEYEKIMGSMATLTVCNVEDLIGNPTDSCYTTELKLGSLAADYIFSQIIITVPVDFTIERLFEIEIEEELELLADLPPQTVKVLKVEVESDSETALEIGSNSSSSTPSSLMRRRSMNDFESLVGTKKVRIYFSVHGIKTKSAAESIYGLSDRLGKILNHKLDKLLEGDDQKILGTNYTYADFYWLKKMNKEDVLPVVAPDVVFSSTDAPTSQNETVPPPAMTTPDTIIGETSYQHEFIVISLLGATALLLIITVIVAATCICKKKDPVEKSSHEYSNLLGVNRFK